MDRDNFLVCSAVVKNSVELKFYWKWRNYTWQWWACCGAWYPWHNWKWSTIACWNLGVIPIWN